MNSYLALGNSERFQEYVHTGSASLYWADIVGGEPQLVWLSAYAKSFYRIISPGFATYREARQWKEEQSWHLNAGWIR
jgi:hypothetical protein